MKTYTLYQLRSNDYTYHNQPSLNRLLIIAVITIALAIALTHSVRLVQ